MKRIIPLLFLLFLLPFSGRAQQKHDKLREIYLRLANDSTKLDSALVYSFKVRDAAVKEYGNKSMQYFRSLNNIGYVYNQQKHYKKSRSWWLKAYKEFRSIDQKAFVKTTSFIYDNLRITYLFNYPKADSAALFTDKYMEVNRKLHGRNSRKFLNMVSNVAADFEKIFGLKKARKYYTMALSTRSELFGPRSKEIVAGLDSLMSRQKETNNADRRLAIYSALDSTYTLAWLDSASRKELDKQDSWNCIYYSAEMMDEALQQKGDTSAKFFIGLDRLGLGYHYVAREDSVGLFCIKKGLSILKQQKRENTRSYIDLMSDLASVYAELKAYKKALAIGEEMLGTVELISGKRSALYAEALIDLGILHKGSSLTDEASYRKASSYIRQAVGIQKELAGENSKAYGKALQKLGGVCIYWAKLDSAEQMFLQAYKILGKSNSLEENYYLCRQIYMSYSYKNEQAKSNQWLQQCIDLKTQQGDTISEEFLTDLYNLTTDQIMLKNWPKALISLNRMEGILNKTKEKTDAIFLNFFYLKAYYFSEQNKLSEAETLLKYVIKIFSDSTYYLQDSDPNIRDLSSASEELAKIYAKQKKYEAALQANQLAITKMLQLGFTKSAAIVSMKYAQKAQILARMQKNDSAVYTYNDALKGLKNGNWEKGTDYQEIKIELATLYWKMGKVAEAEKLMAEACTQLKETMVNNMAGYSEKEKQQYNSMLQQSLYKYYSLQRNLSSTHTEVNTTAYNFLLQSKGLLLNTSDYLTKAIAASSDTALQNKFQHLKNLRKQLAVAYQQNAEAASEPISTEKLETEIEKTEQLLSFNSPVFADFQKQNSLTFKDIQQKLAPEEAAVEFVAFPYSDNYETSDSVVYGAFVITAKTENPAYIPLGNNGLYKELVRGQGTNGRGVTVIADPENISKNTTLYQQLWQPISPYVKDAEKIYLASDGVLNNVSFASLRDNENQYLIDKYELHFVLSSKDIAKAKSSQFAASKPSVALFGGARYSMKNENLATDTLLADRSLPQGLRGGNAWNYLPNTLTEVKNINKILKHKRWQVSNFTGEVASETNFKQLSGAQAPTVLHIATHGFYFPMAQQEKKRIGLKGEQIYNENENPLLRTGLVFSAANAAWLGNPVATGTDDGILTAFEFANMNLSKTELVVLSACETGVGDVLNGEGVFGLQRAIRQAGIGKMIVSLWPVPDKETSEMMQEFYRALAKEKNIVTAFHKAQATMRQRYAGSPVLWAGFELIE